MHIVVYTGLHRLCVICYVHQPTIKVFDTAYVCYAPSDEALLLPCLKNFNNLGVANLTWRPESGSEKETKDLIRESSVFQICWSGAAQVRGAILYVKVSYTLLVGWDFVSTN